MFLGWGVLPQIDRQPGGQMLQWYQPNSSWFVSKPAQLEDSPPKQNFSPTTMQKDLHNSKYPWIRTTFNFVFLSPQCKRPVKVSTCPIWRNQLAKTDSHWAGTTVVVHSERERVSNECVEASECCQFCEINALEGFAGFVLQVTLDAVRPRKKNTSGFVFKIMQFSGNVKGKTPILSKLWAQSPPPTGVKTLFGPPDKNPGSTPENCPCFAAPFFGKELRMQLYNPECF